MSTQYNLHNLDIAAGLHSLTVVAKATGYEDSEASTPISFTAYSVTYSITKGTASGYDMMFSGETLTGSITPNANCDYPLTLIVVGATLDSYNNATGAFQLSNPTGNITVAGTCLETYSISTTLNNATAASGNPSTIKDGSTATLVFTFDGTYYTCPDAVTVSNATGSWTKDSTTQGTLVLSNPTAAVSVTVSGVQVQVTAPYIELGE